MSSERIFELLGGRKNLVREATVGRLRPSQPGQLRAARALRAVRFKTDSVESLSKHLDCSREELLAVLNIPLRTAQRRAEEKELSEAESDRLYRVARVARRAELTFGSTEKAHDWLKTENLQLGIVTPLSLLGTDAGAEQVVDELTRIEYGDLY